ncbi:MAG: hypothetical protein EOP49_47425 [Sphingobacteriales bacterium]|nr:MAG: hypothetical protein EOP49_47425 [Sphingobacteriales bacterium]
MTMEGEIVKQYTNGEITVVWKPSACIHSTICWKKTTGLPTVFNPREKPWIKIDSADSAAIMAQVQQCPSGALSFFHNDKEAEDEAVIESDTKVEMLPNGPLLVYGNLTVRDRDGNETRKSKVTAFCRCGQSKNKPYCDGSHVPAGFNG